MSRVYTGESSIQGTGIFSSDHFSPGEVILKIDDSRVVTDADPLDPAKEEFEQHCDYLANGKVVSMQASERFINHRCDPNTFVRTITWDRYAVAMREIRPGDEITYDYCVNGDGDTASDCSCRSPECRKRHLSGFFHLSVDVQVRYLALLEDWFVAEHRDEVAILKRWVEDGQATGPIPRGLPLSEADLPDEGGGTGMPGVVLVDNPPLGSGDTIPVRRAKVLIFSGCKSHPATGSLQPVAIEATRGGNETVEAFETNGSLWRFGELTGRNASER